MQKEIPFIEKGSLQAELLFTANEPASAVKQNLIKKIKKRIQNTSFIDHSSFINFKDIIDIEGRYCLLRDEIEEEQPLFYFLQKENPGRLKKTKWCLEIARMAQKAEKEKYNFSGITLDCLRVNTENEIKMIDQEIARQIRQYRQEMDYNVEQENFSPPEIIELKQWDQQSRIYTFGVVVYFLLTGQFPFKGKTSADIYDRVLSGSFIEPRFVNPDISRVLNDFILKLLRRKKGQRYQRWSDVIEDLHAIIKNKRLVSGRREQKKNYFYGRLITRYDNARDQVTFAIKRNKKILAIIAIFVLAFFLLGRIGEQPPLITEETEDEQVVYLFYRSFNEKDIDMFEKTTTVDPGPTMERLFAHAYILEQMQDFQRGFMMTIDEERAEEEMIFGIRDLEVTRVADEPSPEFIANYIFFFNEEEQQQTFVMEDTVFLERKEEGIWQIVKIEGDIEKFLAGEIIFEIEF